MEEILKQLVTFYPVSSNQASVKQLLQYVQTVFKECGLHSELLEYNGVYSLYANTQGLKHSKILLQGHIDVVPADKQPFRAENNAYFGRGVYDMLFATACYVQFVKEHAGTLSDLDLGILLSGDEELGGFNSILPILEDGYTADVCILPDAGLGMGTLNVAAKGMYNCTIQINGASHHGSRPWEGDGAAIKLAHFLVEAEGIFDSSNRDNSTMTVAKIVSGNADNQGPKTATAILDIRYCDKTDLERIKTKFDLLLKKYNGEITLLVEGDDYQLDTENSYVQSFINLYEKHHGSAIEQIKAHGSSDARFFNAKNIPVLMLRPQGGGAHGDAEWVSKEELTRFYALLREYILEQAQ